MRRPVLTLALCLPVISLMLPVQSQAAEVRRFGLFVGNNDGHSGDQPLRFAEDDARRLRDALLDVGGFRAEDAVLLLGADAADARRAGEALAKRATQAAQAGADTVLMLFYSGHADAERLHLGVTDLPFSEVRALLEGSGARVTLAVVDACRSGGITRRKGASRAPPFDVRLEPGLAGEGHVALTSSAADEDSQESDLLQGSYFTHHLVSGLRGAADRSGDGAVTLKELYSYAYANTLRSTRSTLAGAQHPAYRYDLEGRGELVLSRLAQPAGRVAHLRFDDPGAWLVMDADSDEVAAEISVPKGGGTLALRPGRYRVSRRDRRTLLEGIVVAPAGGTGTVRAAGLEPIAYARLVRKGGPQADAANHAVFAGAGWQGALTDLTPGMGIMQVGYQLDLEAVTLRPVLHAGRAQAATPTLEYELTQAGAALQVLRLFDAGPISAGPGLSAGGLWMHQALSADEGERTAFGLTLAALLHVGVELGAGLALAADGELGTFTFPFSEDSIAPTGAGALESRPIWRAIALLRFTP